MDGTPWNVVGRDGLRGRIIGSGPIDSMHTAEIELEDGRHINVSGEMLQACENGTFALAISNSDLAALRVGATVTSHPKATNTLSVVQEEVSIEKRTVEADEVAVHITPQTRQEVVDVELKSESVEVHRVPVNQIVEAPAAPHEQGDVTIVPVYEEVLVLQKKLVLKEEIHIRRLTTKRHEKQTVTLRSENVEVLHTKTPQNPPEKQ